MRRDDGPCAAAAGLRLTRLYGGSREPLGASRSRSAWDAARLRRAGTRFPADFRIETYLGHGGPRGVVVRGRVLDDPPPDEAVEGEGVGRRVLRTLRHFLTDELPGVPLRVTVAGATRRGRAPTPRATSSPGCSPSRERSTSPWTTGTVELAGDYRGVDRGRTPRRSTYASPSPTPASG